MAMFLPVYEPVNLVVTMLPIPETDTTAPINMTMALGEITKVMPVPTLHLHQFRMKKPLKPTPAVVVVRGQTPVTKLDFQKLRPRMKRGFGVSIQQIKLSNIVI